MGLRLFIPVIVLRQILLDRRDKPRRFMKRWPKHFRHIECLKHKSPALLQVEKPRDFDPFGQTGFGPFGYNMIDPLKSWCWGVNFILPF